MTLTSIHGHELDTTYNIFTIIQPTVLAQVTEEIKRYNLGILDLLEIRKYHTQINFTLLFSAKQTGENHSYELGTYTKNAP